MAFAESCKHAHEAAGKAGEGSHSTATDSISVEWLEEGAANIALDFVYQAVCDATALRGVSVESLIEPGRAQRVIREVADQTIGEWIDLTVLAFNIHRTAVCFTVPL